MVAEGLINSHILVTGGTGYIGGYLSNKPTAAGYRVTTVSRPWSQIIIICVDLN